MQCHVQKRRDEIGEKEGHNRDEAHQEQNRPFVAFQSGLQAGDSAAFGGKPLGHGGAKAIAGRKKHANRAKGGGDDVIDDAGKQPEQKAAGQGGNRCPRQAEGDNYRIGRNKGKRGDQKVLIAKGNQIGPVFRQGGKGQVIMQQIPAGHGYDPHDQDRQAAFQAGCGQASHIGQGQIGLMGQGIILHPGNMADDLRCG